MSARRTAPAVETHAEAVTVLAAAMLRTGGWCGAVVAVLALVAATVLAGVNGLLGAAVGAAVGFASSLTTIGLMRLVAKLPVEASFGAVLGGYVTKIVLLLVIVVPMRGVSWLHPLALGLSVLAVVVAWTVAEVVAFRRTPIPTIIPAKG